jgi:hypothetical protein
MEIVYCFLNPPCRLPTLAKDIFITTATTPIITITIFKHHVLDHILHLLLLAHLEASPKRAMFGLGWTTLVVGVSAELVASAVLFEKSLSLLVEFPESCVHECGHVKEGVGIPCDCVATATAAAQLAI